MADAGQVLTASALVLWGGVTALLGLTLGAASVRVRLALWLTMPGWVAWQEWSQLEALSVVPLYALLVLLLLASLLEGLAWWRGAAKRPRWLLALVALPLWAVPPFEAWVVAFDAEDHRRDRWTDAFDGLHEILEQRYAFGAHKAIDWDGLRERFRPQVAEAESTGDEEALYLALRRYVFSLPDGHVSIRSPRHEALWEEAAGAGFGFALLALDDGAVVTHLLEDDGPAARAGMQWGAEVLTWNGQPVRAALQAVSTVWTSRPIATQENRALVQQQLLTRAPAGTRLEITFQNRDGPSPQTVTLTARSGGLDTYWASVHADVRAPVEAPVTHEVLRPGVGYVRVDSLEHSASGQSPPEALDQALEDLVAQGVRGLIIDVRGNRGGMDQLVPQMMGRFTTQELYYEGVTVFSPLLGRFTQLISLRVEPRPPVFSGPLVVLVDHRTKSSGEGFALLAKSIPSARVMGLHATDGSFGMAEATVHMPAGITVGFPWGQSVDGDGAVQVEGDHALHGGVQPDVRVPLTWERARAMYLDGRDVVLDAAVVSLRDSDKPLR